MDNEEKIDAILELLKDIKQELISIRQTSDYIETNTSSIDSYAGYIDSSLNEIKNRE
jgi:hypothetical protein